MAKTMSAIYEDVHTAQQVVHKLAKNGIQRHDIVILANGEPPVYDGHVDLDMPNGSKTRSYADAIRQGRAVVIAWMMKGWDRKAAGIMKAHNPLDFDERPAQWN